MSDTTPTQRYRARVITDDEEFVSAERDSRPFDTLEGSHSIELADGSVMFFGGSLKNVVILIEPVP